MPSANRTVTPFAEDIVRHEMCAFVPGYFKFIAETEVTVQSILQFMRGMRVVVAVHPTDIFVYQRFVRGRVVCARSVGWFYVGCVFAVASCVVVCLLGLFARTYVSGRSPACVLCSLRACVVDCACPLARLFASSCSAFLALLVLLALLALLALPALPAQLAFT